MEPLQDGEALIRAAVVHDDDLVGPPKPLQHRRELGVKGFNGLLLVEEGNHDGQLDVAHNICSDLFGHRFTQMNTVLFLFIRVNLCASVSPFLSDDPFQSVQDAADEPRDHGHGVEEQRQGQGQGGWHARLGEEEDVGPLPHAQAAQGDGQHQAEGDEGHEEHEVPRGDPHSQRPGQQDVDGDEQKVEGEGDGESSPQGWATVGAEGPVEGPDRLPLGQGSEPGPAIPQPSPPTDLQQEPHPGEASQGDAQDDHRQGRRDQAVAEGQGAHRHGQEHEQAAGPIHQHAAGGNGRAGAVPGQLVGPHHVAPHAGRQQVVKKGAHEVEHRQPRQGGGHPQGRQQSLPAVGPKHHAGQVEGQGPGQGGRRGLPQRGHYLGDPYLAQEEGQQPHAEDDLEPVAQRSTVQLRDTR